MGGDEPLEIRDDRLVASRGQLGVDEQLGRLEASVLQSGDLDSRERRLRQIGERRATPQRESRAKALCVLGRPLGGAAPRDQAPEALEVELAGLDPEGVAAATRLQPLAPEEPAQPVDVHLQRVRRSLGRLVAPQRLDEALARDDLVRVEEQVGEQRALLRPSEGQLRPPLAPRAARAVETPSPGSPGSPP